MNYDYALLELNYVGHFGKRELMILDEAHNIEDKLMKRLEVNIHNQRLKKDLNTVLSEELISSSPDPQDWIMQVDAVVKGYKELNVKDLPKNKADRVHRTVARLGDLTDKLEKNRKIGWLISIG